jgi:2-amino-4-hydroxy-6-hydroxymethyldihydropteridine diphosphokinase
MILIGLGGNLDGPWGTPRETVMRAFAALDHGPIRLHAASSLIVTPPFGRRNQPDFVNAAARIETHLSPDALLRRLHMIEHQAGRARRLRWGPRTLDLDLLDYHGLIRPKRTLSIKPLVLPHPGIAERLFVLEPLAEIEPSWRHPLTHERAAFMIRKRYRLDRP